jgi:hypothetical protein
VCENFHCLPHEAIQAIDNDVDGLLFRIIGLRAYADAKEHYDSTPVEKRKQAPMVEMVSEFTIELVKERIARARAEAEGQ